MELTEYVKTLGTRKTYIRHKHGQDFFDLWDQMFNLRTIPEQPGRYKDE